MTDEKRDPLELLPPEVRERAEADISVLVAEVHSANEQRDQGARDVDGVVGVLERSLRHGGTDAHGFVEYVRGKDVQVDALMRVLDELGLPSDDPRYQAQYRSIKGLLNANRSMMQTILKRIPPTDPDERREMGAIKHAEGVRIGWTQAALWLRTDAARAAFVDAGAMSISYADRQVVANVLEAALSRCAEGTPMDVFNQAVAKRGG